MDVPRLSTAGQMALSHVDDLVVFVLDLNTPTETVVASGKIATVSQCLADSLCHLGEFSPENNEGGASGDVSRFMCNQRRVTAGHTERLDAPLPHLCTVTTLLSPIFNTSSHSSACAIV